MTDMLSRKEIVIGEAIHKLFAGEDDESVLSYVWDEAQLEASVKAKGE